MCDCCNCMDNHVSEKVLDLESRSVMDEESSSKMKKYIEKYNNMKEEQAEKLGLISAKKLINDYNSGAIWEKYIDLSDGSVAEALEEMENKSDVANHSWFGNEVIFALIFCFLCNFVLTRIAIGIFSKVRNPTRDYVPKTEGEKRKVSPFGGLCLFVSSIFTCFIFGGGFSLIFLIPTVLIFFLGFYDDIVKVLSDEYVGISARKKLFFQSLIAVLVCFLGTYYNPNFDEFKIIIPFYGIMAFKMPMFLSFFIVYFAFTGTVNAVNLTDGLDGLAGKQVLVILAFLLTLLYSVKFNLNFNVSDLQVVLSAFFGGCLAFLCFNSNPASIFMGDAGSMGLGSLISTVFIFLKIELILPFICFVIFMEILSVIIQVCYFKLTNGKRLFKMSPIHHHFQLCGWKEQKITEVAFCLTIFLAVLFQSSFL